MKKRFVMSWDENELARAFKVTTDDIREYLTDGRRVSFIIERRLKWENPGWTLAPSEGAGYDLRDPEGGLWGSALDHRRRGVFQPLQPGRLRAEICGGGISGEAEKPQGLHSL
ncbi:MAG TPA: hypothetical protein VFC47_09830 [Caulobacteraceae bacterium]|nr:hypothetical protein [Caulobacteraceae bacterium]